MEQYSGVHLREGRSLGQPNLRNSGNLQSKSSRPSGYRPKGKGKTYRAYTADAWYEEDPIYEKDLIKPLMKIPRQGTPKTQKVMVKTTRTTSYPSPKQ